MVTWNQKKMRPATRNSVMGFYTQIALQMPLSYPIVLHLDNQSAIALANSEGQFHARTKHIDICYHFIKFTVQNGTIVLLYCPTENMIANILTKPIPLIKHKYLTHDLGLILVWGGVLESNRLYSYVPVCTCTATALAAVVCFFLLPFVYFYVQ